MIWPKLSSLFGRYLGVHSRVRAAAFTGRERRAAAVRFVALVGLAAILAAFALLAEPWTSTDAILAFGALAMLIACYIAMGLTRAPPRLADLRAAEVLGDEVASQLEHVKDAHWALSDNEARYRDLLDTQAQIIVQRDRAANVVFANRAFCLNFDVSPSAVIGTPFQPIVLDTDDQAGASATWRGAKTVEELVQTVNGPRWIAWDELKVPASDGAFETQRIGRDVTDERVMEAMLREACEQSDAANRAKSRFLAAMSHEIRTPMNGILGMASLLRQTPLDAEQKEYSAVIDTSTRALLALIDEILDFSKIEAGRIELAHDVFSLRHCLEGALQLLAPRADEKQLSLQWSIDGDVTDGVRGDAVRVRQIILNLLSNAIKFTDNGSIRVRVSSLLDGADGVGPNIAIAVADTGIGLSVHDMTILFAEFEQAEAAISRRTGGTGLGLAISKRLARAMGGDIAVEGRLGKGATFTARLRLAEAGDAAAAISVPLEAPAIAHMKVAHAPDAASAHAQPRTYVLIAEDNDINALLARRVVEKAGGDWRVVGDGQSAIDAVRASLRPGARAFDLVLMDVFLPVLDGLQATRAIRQMFDAPDAAGCRPPAIVALTANAFAEDRARCLEAGMDDYLAKPFDAEDLAAVMRRWLAENARVQPGTMVANADCA
ncbi:MAG: ATP-binding protein [Hyphomicrobium sp.]